MPVRGSSEWRHAIIGKKIINLDMGGDGRVTESGTHYVMCAWDTCEKDGLEMYKIVKHLGVMRGERTMNYVFCSEKHRQYFLDDLHRAKVQ